MPKLLRVSYRHQITIPPSIMKDAGLSEGSYVAIEAHGGKIILEPKEVAEKDFSQEDWNRLDKLVHSQTRSGQYKEYPSPKEAKKHFK